jgi:hypothetical protein
MVVVLRYVDKCGIMKDRFVGVVHVTFWVCNVRVPRTVEQHELHVCLYMCLHWARVVHVTETTSSHLKSSFDFLLEKFKLSLKECRSQGYDGTSNM